MRVQCLCNAHSQQPTYRTLHTSHTANIAAIWAHANSQPSSQGVWDKHGTTSFEPGPEPQPWRHRCDNRGSFGDPSAAYAQASRPTSVTCGFPSYSPAQHRPLRAHASLRKLSGPGRLMPTHILIHTHTHPHTHIHTHTYHCGPHHLFMEKRVG